MKKFSGLLNKRKSQAFTHDSRGFAKKPIQILTVVNHRAKMIHLRRQRGVS